MVKGIIFDLNGVFIQSPFLSDRLKNDYGVNSDEFLSALKQIMGIVRLPSAPPIYELFKTHLVNWGVDLSEEEFYKYWFEAEKENVELTRFAQKLKSRGIDLYILSNNFKERADYYDKNLLFIKELFKKVYYSWQTGFLKTDRRAYELLLEENNLKGEECLFYDDSSENIEIAKSLGINATLYTNDDKLIESINSFL